MLSDKKYGLTVSILATRVMLDHLDEHQRNNLKGDLDLPKQPECLKLRTERGMDSMAIPNLVIRRPSVIQVGGI